MNKLQALQEAKQLGFKDETEKTNKQFKHTSYFVVLTKGPHMYDFRNLEALNRFISQEQFKSEQERKG